jgi:hypothetical protein
MGTKFRYVVVLLPGSPASGMQPRRMYAPGTYVSYQGIQVLEYNREML